VEGPGTILQYGPIQIAVVGTNLVFTVRDGAVLTWENFQFGKKHEELEFIYCYAVK